MFKRSILMLALVAVSGVAHAAPRSSYSSSSSGQHSVGANLGFDRKSGVGIGADYQYALPAISVGGYFQIFNKNTDNTNFGIRSEDGAWMLGAQAVAHYTTEHLDAYMGPGLGLITIDPAGANQSSKTTIGPRLTLGLLYNINDKIGLGVENARYWAWFNSDYAGFRIDHFAIKFRIAF